MNNSNNKAVCVCGGKYTATNKSKHDKTKKHLKYLENMNNNRPIKTKEDIEKEVSFDIECDTITEHDPEYLILNVHTIDKQLKILGKISPTNVPKSKYNKRYYFSRVMELYDEIKGGNLYVYRPPNKNEIRKETIERYTDDGYEVVGY